MSFWESYYLAKNVSDALEALAAAPGPARVIAGGTDLLLDLQQGRHAPVHTLVDVTAVPEMTCLELRSESLYIGAAVPLNQIVHSPLVLEHAQALHEAAGLIGGPQVRNTATLGGNVAHALPAADGTISLMALGALAEVAGHGGCRQIPLGQLFLGPGRSALDPRGELLLGFYLPLRGPGEGSAFRRVMRPQGVAIAILNTAVWVRRRGDRIESARIAVGPSGAVPLRMPTAEAALAGRFPDGETVQAALDALLASARFRTSPHRSTAEYRRKMAGVLLEETLAEAYARAAGG